MKPYFRSCSMAESLHSIYLKSVVVSIISPGNGKVRESRLMVKPVLLIPTCAKHGQTTHHTTGDTSFSYKEQVQYVFKAFYSIASRQTIFVLWVVLQLCRNTL